LTAFDRRLTPARADLAAKHLQGQVQAVRFVEGERRVVADAIAPVRREPSPDAALETEALRGEGVTVYETNQEGWCWGQLEDDGYVGWLPAVALDAPGPAPTHRVAVLRTLVFPGRSIKAPPMDGLPLGARVHVSQIDGSFAAIAPSGFIPPQHLALLNSAEADWVAVAERFLGAPYLWGGKSSLGIDCSGLVQVSLRATGVACPRDSDMQENAMGERVGARDAVTQLRRGDLIFWKGHVAIARDATTLIHANAFHMAVAVEPAAEAIARISAAGSEVTSVRRIV
jgi:hypothetical protein